MSKRITVAEMAPHVHTFSSKEEKLKKISNWLIAWIKNSLANGKIKEGDLLPSKGELAFHIGVSVGTIQNAYRIVEDLGLVQSKQRIGTQICNGKSQIKLKSNTKRDCAVEILKKYIIEKKIRIGEKVPPIRTLAKELKISNTTLKFAIENLVLLKILTSDNGTFFVNQNEFLTYKKEKSTLVGKVAHQIKERYISDNLLNNKLPTNKEIAKELNVSVKTVNDSIKLLSKDINIHIKRGNYGTIILNENTSKENYHYIRVEEQIRRLIYSDYQIGMRLPSIKELSKKYNVSTKTIRRSLFSLEEDGYITFVRGRYGGTFITDIPQNTNDAYKWLAINPQFINEQN